MCEWRVENERPVAKQFLRAFEPLDFYLPACVAETGRQNSIIKGDRGFFKI